MDQKQSENRSGISASSEESKITSQTPQKTNEPLVTETKFPERYEIIAEFFNQMICSLRLLNLCKKSPTFRNVSSQVEVLTKRKFLYRHLAQIKYVLPEAVQIDKVLVHDKNTLCMVPDVKITLLFDGVGVHPEQSGVMALRELFASRLEDFVSLHVESYDVPEAMLPELFDQNLQTSDTLENVAGLSVGQSEATFEVENLLEVPTASQHFRKYFSEKVIVADSGKTSLLLSQSTHLPSESRNKNSVDTLCAEPEIVNGQTINSGQDEGTPEGFRGVATSSKSSQLANTGPSAGSTACESPAVKVSSSAESLLIETPAQLTPKRAISNVDNDRKSTHSEKCMSCHKSTKRSLNFSMEGDDGALSFAVVEPKGCEHVPSNSNCATELMGQPSISASRAILQKNPLVQERCNRAKDHSFIQISSGMYQHMSSSLPGTVAAIDYIFQAGGCFSITKEELVYKIIINNYDIVERREVEEQVEVLEKLVPDWIQKKSTPSGDIIYSVKRVSNIKSILSRLVST